MLGGVWSARGLAWEETGSVAAQFRPGQLQQQKVARRRRYDGVLKRPELPVVPMVGRLPLWRSARSWGLCT
jgi:hypothetical protein